jgi:hypothetical protein
VAVTGGDLRGQVAIALAITMLALAITAPSAGAAATRAEYAAQVNPICAYANAQIEQVYREIEAKIKRLERKQKKAGKNNGSSVIVFNATATESRKKKKRDGLLDPFDRLFLEISERTLAISAAALGQLRQVAPAPGDEALVTSWLANRQMIQELGERSARLERQSLRLFNRSDRIHSIRGLKRLEQKERRLNRQSNRLYAQLEPAYELDVELGTQLGATYCVTGATGA